MSLERYRTRAIARFALGVWLSGVVAVSYPAPTEAQTSSEAVSDAQADRLEAALKKVAAVDEAARGWSVLSALLVAVSTISAGVYIGTTDRALERVGPTLLSALSITVGSGVLAFGVAAAAHEPASTELLDRWKVARTSGTLDRVAMGRFEGELAARARSEYSLRYALTYSFAFAHAGAAVGFGVLTATTAESRRERISGYVLVGGFTLAAVLTLMRANADTTAQRAWRNYAESNRAEVTPTIAQSSKPNAEQRRRRALGPTQ